MRAHWIAAGPLLWALHFAVLYGVTTFACTRGLPGLVPWTVACATLSTAAAMAVLMQRGYRSRRELVAWLSAGAAALGLIGVVFEALTVVFIPTCTK